MLKDIFTISIILTLVNSNVVKCGEVPDPISYIFGCNFAFALSVMVTFFKLLAWLNVLAKISTWWHLSSCKEAAFSGSDKVLRGLDLPAILRGSYENINKMKRYISKCMT